MHGYREFPQFNIDVYCLSPPQKKTGNLMDIDIPKIAMFKESFYLFQGPSFLLRYPAVSDFGSFSLRIQDPSRKS